LSLVVAVRLRVALVLVAIERQVDLQSQQELHYRS
jgi:hypothetical protein